MQNNFYTPTEVVQNNIDGQITKANLSLFKMIMLGIFAALSSHSVVLRVTYQFIT